MITVRTNSADVLGRIRLKVNALTNKDQLLRTLATNTRAAMKYRIHTEGLASDGSPIGNYSEEYMKVRTGRFATNSVFSKGKNKGEKKPEGVFTKGKNKGQPRPKYNRTSDTKVISSLTRQMENDFVVVATAKGYGIGYSNSENFKKVGYVEHAYKGKKIFRMTAEERENNRKTAMQFVKDNLHA